MSEVSNTDFITWLVSTLIDGAKNEEKMLLIVKLRAVLKSRLRAWKLISLNEDVKNIKIMDLRKDCRNSFIHSVIIVQLLCTHWILNYIKRQEYKNNMSEIYQQILLIIVSDI